MSGVVFVKMGGRKRFSGVEYKRLVKEKTEREEKVLAEVPNLDEFLEPKPRECKPSTLTAHRSLEIESRYPHFQPNFFYELKNVNIFTSISLPAPN